MLALAFTAIKQQQQTLAVTSSAKTSAQLLWKQENADSTLFIVQPLDSDVWVTVDGQTNPVVGSVGFCIQQKIPTMMTAGEMVNARWICASACNLTVQGGQGPMWARPMA